MKTMLKLGVHKSVNVKEIMIDVITKKKCIRGEQNSICKQICHLPMILKSKQVAVLSNLIFLLGYFFSLNV